MKYEIKNRWTGAVIYAADAESLRGAVESTIRSGANLTGADLTGADLRGADLRGANLTGANLTDADP